MILENWLEWLTVFGYLAVTVLIFWQIVTR